VALPGVYTAKKKDGKPLYRSSITYRGKHISLGSYPTEQAAHLAYLEADRLLLAKNDLDLTSYEPKDAQLSFEKWVVLLNFRDNGMYFKTPIYLKQNYFLYYLDMATQLKFAVDDLFYYAEHKITRRGGHLFVADFGMQVNILSRYGIKNFAVCGRDYVFANGDNTDFRYENIIVINKYYGVEKVDKCGRIFYQAKIHIRGYYIIGRYLTECEAAVAYNKAADFLENAGLSKSFQKNYILELNEEQYKRVYEGISLPKKLESLSFS
jgi:hypothetical protein